MKKIFGAFSVRWRAKDGENAFALVPSLSSISIPLAADGYVANEAEDFTVAVAMVIGSARVTQFTSLTVAKVLGGTFGFLPVGCTASTGLVAFNLSWDDNVVKLGVLNNIFRVTGTCRYNGETYTASCDISVCFTQNGKDADPVIELRLSNPLVTIPLDSDGDVAGNVSEERRVTMYKGGTPVAITSITCTDRGTFGPTGDAVWNYVVGNAANADMSRTITVKASSGAAGGGMTTDTLNITATATIDGKSVTRMVQLEIVATTAGQSTTGQQGDAYTIDGPDLITYNSKTDSVMPERATWTARNNGKAVSTMLRAIYNGSQISTFTSGGEFGIADFLDQEAPGLKSGGTFTLQMLENNAVVATKTVVVEAVRYVIYRGPTAWEEGRVYYGGEWDAEAENFIIDIVTQKESGTTYFFYCRQKNRKKTSSQTAESYDINVTPYADTQNNPIGTYWKRAQKIPFVATDLLLADGAVLDWLQGRTMTLTNRNSNVVGGLTGDLEDNINTLLWLGASYTNRGNAPFRVTSDGELTSSKANITGKLTAKGINLSQHIIDTTASVAVTEPGTYIADIAKTGNQMDLTLDPSDFEEGDIVTICHPVKDGQDYFISIRSGSAEFYQGILVGYNNSSFDQDAGYDATVFQPSGAGGVYLEVSGDLYGVGGIFPCKTASGYGLLSYYPSNTYMKGQNYYTRCYFSGGTVELMVVRNDINEKVFYVKSRQAMYWQTTCNVSASGLYPMYSTLIETCGRAIAFYTSNNTWAW